MSRKICVATVIQRYDGRFLMAYHVKNAGWQFVGGKTEGAETMQAAIERELLEETGLHPQLWFLGYHDVDPEWLTLIFYGRWYSDSQHGALENKEPEKHRDMGWYHLHEIPGTLTVTGRAVLAKFYPKELKEFEDGAGRNACDPGTAGA